MNTKLRNKVGKTQKKIQTPIEIQRIRFDELLLFYLNVNFFHKQLRKMTKWTSYLVKNGQRVCNRELKRGTHMVDYGFIYVYEEIGKYFFQ